MCHFYLSNLYRTRVTSDQAIPIRASFFEFFGNYKLLHFIIFQNKVSIFILES